MKLKGIVTDDTMRGLIHNAVKHTIVEDEKDQVRYWTQKSRFLAKKRGVCYWEIYHIMGSELEPELPQTETSQQR